MVQTTVGTQSVIHEVVKYFRDERQEAVDTMRFTDAATIVIRLTERDDCASRSMSSPIKKFATELITQLPAFDPELRTASNGFDPRLMRYVLHHVCYVSMRASESGVMHAPIAKRNTVCTHLKSRLLLSSPT